MTDPIQRHRITTRYDAHVWSTTGIAADLEQQRRERTWRDRLPSREDLGWFVIGIGIVLCIVGVLAGAIIASDLLLRALGGRP